MNGMSTKAELNIIPLGYYDCLIGMDKLDQHHAILDCRNKAFTCLDEEGNQKTVQEIPRAVAIREISAMQLKKCYRKGCQLFAAHVEETPKDKVSGIGDHAVLKEFEDVFQEVPGLPPKRDIDFSVNLMPGATPISKAPVYRGCLMLECNYMRVKDMSCYIVYGFIPKSGWEIYSCYRNGCQ
jgi:hypothetical protein